MMVQVLILLVGFFLLVKGADWFVEGAASIAKKLGIPQLVIDNSWNYSGHYECFNSKINVLL